MYNYTDEKMIIFLQKIKTSKIFMQYLERESEGKHNKVQSSSNE